MSREANQVVDALANYGLNSLPFLHNFEFIASIMASKS